MDSTATQQQTSRRKAIKAVFGTVAAALWVLALFLEAYADGTPGIMALLGGWLTLLMDNLLGFFAWCGNFLFFVGYLMFLFGRKQSTFTRATVLAALAFVCSFGALTIMKHIDGGTSEPVVASVGTYVWMASLLVLLVGSALNLLKGSR
ncbi:MAG TPA: hypothetical protein VK826_03590 [Bacteroidia bacterium]|nr:hypothetical protein [Bacteroidia bacterium]